MRVLVLLMLLTSVAAAQAPTPKADQYNRFKTAIINGGFENGTSQWSASGGSFSVSTTSGNFRSGLRGAVFNASAGSQTLTSAANTLSSGNNQVSCWFKTTATDYKFQAWDGTNVVAEQTIPALSQFTKLVLNVGMSSPAALRARVISASDAADLIVDDCMSGEADNVGNGNFATDWASFTPTGTWSTNTTYTGQKRRVGDTGEYDVLISLAGAPTTANLAINLPSTEVIDTSKLVSTSDDYSTLGTCSSLDSGTGSFVGTVAYVSTTAVRVKFIATANANNNSQIQVDQVSPMTFANGDRINCRFKAPIVGWSAQTVFNPDTIAWRVDANIGGANPSLGLSAVTSYSEITNASLDLVQNTGSIPVQIPCSSTNASSGLTCSSGSESLGVVFNIPRAGAVRACASYTHYASLDASGDGLNVAFQLVETPNNAQTILQEGKTRNTSYSYSTATGQLDEQKPWQLCGTFNFTSAGQKTLRLMYEQVVASTPANSLILADRDTGAGQRDIHWEVYPIDQAIPAPLLVGSVTSAAISPLKIESAIIDNNGTCSVSYESSDWLGTLGHPGLGQCSLPINSGQWSDLSKVVCQCTLLTNAQNGHCNFNQALPFSSPIVTVTVNSGATGVDVPYTLTCMGPK